MKMRETDLGPLPAALEHAVRGARRLKEAQVRDTHDPSRGATDIAPVVQGWRGSQPVVLLAPARMNPDDALYAARLAAVGFGCDILSFTTEGWQAADPERNPTTGRPWGPGEMQRAVEEEGALEAGWITEALTTNVVNRAGDVLGAVLPYRVDRRLSALGITSYSLQWGQQPNLSRDAEWGGLLVDHLVEFMNEPPVDALMAQADLPSADSLGLSGEEARAHIDCAVVKTLRSSGFEGAVMLQADSPVRASVIERSLVGYGGMRSTS
jgi:hypothetical protein